MDDPSVQRTRISALFDRLAPVYDQGPIPWFAPIADRLVELLAPVPGATALDVSAGRGAATFPLARAVGETGHVVAADISAAMIRLLTDSLQASGTANVRTLVGEATPRTLPAGTFDLVAASLVLFFDPDPAGTLRDWLALLRPGGRIGISTFGAQDVAWRHAEAEILRYAPTVADPRTSGVAGPFATPESLGLLFGEAGATEITICEEPLEVTLPDAAAWRDWTMTLGMRQIWDAVPPDESTAVVDRVGALLEADRGADGLLHLTQQVRYTIARKP